MAGPATSPGNMQTMSPFFSKATMSCSNTAELSTLFGLPFTPFCRSLALCMGTAPTDSMSQEEKVFSPNNVDFAVIRIHFRFERGTEVMRMRASVRELAAWESKWRPRNEHVERLPRQSRRSPMLWPYDESPPAHTLTVISTQDAWYSIGWYVFGVLYDDG